MRHLLQSRILLWAILAASVSTLASYPRLLLWSDREIPVWYLEVSIFVCCIVLWAFIFAWHPVYTKKPVFRAKADLGTFSIVTLIGLVFTGAWHFWLDPVLKSKMPEEFPADWQHWLASLLFALGVGQLFLIFAPFDWLMRLCRHQKASMILTALLGVGIAATKLHAKSPTISTEWLLILLSAKFGGGLLAVIIYLRGGIILAWWWAVVLHCRHLLDFL